MLKNTLKVLKKIGGKLGLLKITWALGVRGAWHVNGTDCGEEAAGRWRMTDNKMLTQPKSIMDTGCSKAIGLSR